MHRPECPGPSATAALFAADPAGARSRGGVDGQGLFAPLSTMLPHKNMRTQPFAFVRDSIHRPRTKTRSDTHSFSLSPHSFTPFLGAAQLLCEISERGKRPLGEADESAAVHVVRCSSFFSPRLFLFFDLAGSVARENGVTPCFPRSLLSSALAPEELTRAALSQLQESDPGGVWSLLVLPVLRIPGEGVAAGAADTATRSLLLACQLKLKAEQ